MSPPTAAGADRTFPWPSPLVRATLLGRYVRFLADARLDDGAVVRVHCANSGRMEGLVRPGSTIYLSRSSSTTRKLAYTWQASEIDGALVGADTSIPNRFVGHAVTHGWIEGAGDEGIVRPERPFGEGHRVDFVLGPDESPHYVEVKNCHLVYRDGFAYFPDSKSERAARHARALEQLARAGVRASVWFTVQRLGAHALRPSEHHDPDFARALREAAAAGVAVRAFVVEPTATGLVLRGEIPVELEPYPVAPVRALASELAQTAGWKGKTPQLGEHDAAAAPSSTERARTKRASGRT